MKSPDSEGKWYFLIRNLKKCWFYFLCVYIIYIILLCVSYDADNFIPHNILGNIYCIFKKSPRKPSFYKNSLFDRMLGKWPCGTNGHEPAQSYPMQARAPSMEHSLLKWPQNHHTASNYPRSAKRLHQIKDLTKWQIEKCSCVESGRADQDVFFESSQLFWHGVPWPIQASPSSVRPRST